VSVLGSPALAAEWLADHTGGRTIQSSVFSLGALGASARAGLWASGSLALRLTRAANLGGADLSAVPWATLAEALAPTSLVSGSPAPTPALVAALAAANSTVLVPVDSELTAKETAVLTGSVCSRMCGPAPAGAPAGTPALVLSVFAAKLGVYVACKLVPGGELGLRMAMAAQAAAQGGRPDLLACVPSEPSLAVLDGVFGMRRLNLPEFSVDGYASAVADWPLEPAQKIANAAVRNMFPRTVWQTLEVRAGRGGAGRARARGGREAPQRCKSRPTRARPRGANKTLPPPHFPRPSSSSPNPLPPLPLPRASRTLSTLTHR